MTDRKKCSKCEVVKSVDKFCKNKRSPDEHHYWCKECANKQARKASLKRRKTTLPFWICPKCGIKIRLKFFPRYEGKRWKKFKCPKCKFSPYGK